MTRTTRLLLHTPISRVNLVFLASLLSFLKFARVVVSVVGVFIVGSVLIQLIYPTSIARPYAKLDGKSISFNTKGAIQSKFTNYDNTKRVIQIGKTTYSTSLSSIGIKSDVANSTAKAVDYPLFERLKPFSFFKSTNIESSKKVDNKKLTQTIQKYASQNAVTPTNPKIEKVASDLKIIPGSSGVSFDQAKLKAMLVSIPTETTKIEYSGETQLPIVSEQKLKAAIESINSQSSKEFKLVLEGKSYKASPEQIRSWSNVNVDEKSGNVTTSFDTPAIKKWLLATAPITIKPASASRNVVVDDVVVQRIPGQSGVIVDADKTAINIYQALKTNSNQANAVLATVAAPVQQSKSFSATSQGISLLIANWAKSHPGMTAGVTFIEIGGQSRQAVYNGDRKFYPASIYKLFTTLYLNAEIAAGRIDPNAIILPGKSINTCMDLMIVVSDNNCPQAVAQVYGWGSFETAARNNGFNSTFINSSFLTTTNDVAKYLIALNNGSLMNAADSSTLISRMQRQIYRSAIPAGSPGCTVADKVGFYGSYWHDAAVVTCPNAKYVLVVFTQNGSSKAIKDLASQISGLL